MSGVMKRIVAIIIAMILIMAPLSTCFAAGTGITEEIIIEIVWETLRGWGIEILEQGYTELTQNVSDWLNGGLREYLTNELSEAFEQWITGMQWIYDNFGRRILNDLGIQNIYDFATWFANRYGLINNNSVQVSGGITVDSLTAYYLPIEAPRASDPTIYNEYSHYSGTNGEYALFAIRTTNGVDSLYIYILNSFSSTIKDLKHYGTNNESVSYHNLSYNSTYQKFLWISSGYPLTGSARWVWDAFTAYPEDTVIAALSYNPVPESGISIVTHDIEYPVDNPDYQTGYSIIYYPDGTVGYIDINWPDAISVNNLPAVISPTGAQDPGFSQAFLPVKAFVNTFSDGIDLMTDIVYHCPAQIVMVALAIIGINIIFGALHMFKEH